MANASSKFSLQDPVNPCIGLSGRIAQYRISFQTGFVVVTENVNIARCTAGRCSHTFEPPSNPPSSYDSVSVAAENVVGVGPARTCTAQPISELLLAETVQNKQSVSCQSLAYVYEPCCKIIMCNKLQWISNVVSVSLPGTHKKPCI